MSQPDNLQKPIHTNRHARSSRSLYRLSILFLIYPIYKTVDYFARDQLLQAIYMLLISVVYVIALFYLLSKKSA